MPAGNSWTRRAALQELCATLTAIECATALLPLVPECRLVFTRAIGEELRRARTALRRLAGAVADE